MRIILKNILKRKVILLIEDIGLGVFQIIIDIQLSFIKTSSIEFNKGSGAIFLHAFEDDGFDLVFDFDDLSIDDMFKIIEVLNSI
jgi:hypothetical protein